MSGLSLKLYALWGKFTHTHTYTCTHTNLDAWNQIWFKHCLYPTIKTTFLSTFSLLIEGKTSQPDRSSGCQLHLHPFCGSRIYLITKSCQFSLLNTLSHCFSFSVMSMTTHASVIFHGIVFYLIILFQVFYFSVHYLCHWQGYHSIRYITLCHPLHKTIQWLSVTHRNTSSVTQDTKPRSIGESWLYLPPCFYSHVCGHLS